ncbi:aminoacetone oxidase family FAD-binding enzyme [bacterium]|nr:aminoacetone oxidase family FAD-binding enzyme [bacterium]
MAKQISIIGGGAAGFFAAINIAERNPKAKITIYEGSNSLLSKVLISGGGRCNVTTAIQDPFRLSKQYPRGHEVLEPVFKRFGSKETYQWFENRGVRLKTEEDGRVFPRSNSSSSIYNVLVDSAKKLGVKVELNHRLKDIRYIENSIELDFQDQVVSTDYLILSTGSNKQVWGILSKLGYEIVAPVPSLFTFKSKDPEFKSLAGVSVQDAEVRISGVKGQFNGPLLITHRGFSGPAILKSSAWLAQELEQKNYSFELIISWVNPSHRAKLEDSLRATAEQFPKEKVLNWRDHGLPKRLYQHLFERTKLREYTNWSEIGKKGVKALLEQIFECKISISGKDTFKEEFVTAGGIDLKQLNMSNFQSKLHPEIYFAGEVLNIDAITGGFNFQAAWSGAFLIAEDLTR